MECSTVMMGYFKKIVNILSALILFASLQGCMSVATSGAQALYNRQGLQKSFKDQYITMQAYKALFLDTDQFKNANIIVSTYHGEMLLAGQAPSAWQKSRAEEIVKTIPDNEKIYNLIAIEGPSSPLTRVSDTWITTKVKSKFLASNDMDGTQIKVITENGTVYLMGVLLPEHAAEAVDLASHTDGVQRVVRIFSYIKISKKA